MTALRSGSSVARTFLGIAILGLGLVGACTLNPQPLPPSDFGGGGGSTSPTPGLGGDRSGADATTSDAQLSPSADGGAGLDSAPPDATPDGKGDANDDASDAPRDAVEEG